MHPSWYGTLRLGTGATVPKKDAFVHRSWYGTLCVGTGATVRYRMHLRILAAMVHCVLVQVLLCNVGCTCAS